jgi:hypothetical protein
MPEAKTEPTVAVALDLPRSTVARLDALARERGDALARERGKDRDGVIVDLVQAAKPMTLAEVLAPVHEEFRRSVMSEAELDELLEKELKAHREGR